MILEKRRQIVGLLLTTVLGLTSSHSLAQALPAPEGRVILTVTGDITNTNAGDRAEFDRDMMEALGMSELQTATVSTDGRPVFSGVLAAKLLDAVGARGESIVARALNDYEVTIPTADFRNYPVLLALKQDGRYLSVRDKGPIWIIYPWEDAPELDNEQTKQKWVWQLTALHVR